MPTTALMIEALLHSRLAPGGVPEDHFWMLMERFRADLVNQAFSILGSQADAEDAAQETLCKAFLHLNQLRDAVKLGTWLRSINRREALELSRRKRSAKEERLGTGQLGAIEAPRPAGNPAAGEEAVARAVDALPEPFREVVVLRYWEKISTEEIANRLGIPSGTVRSRLTRADGMLANTFKSMRTHQEESA